MKQEKQTKQNQETTYANNMFTKWYHQEDTPVFQVYRTGELKIAMI